MLFTLSVGMMALLGPSSTVYGYQAMYTSSSSIQLDPLVSKTVLHLPSLPRPDILVRANFAINAPKRHRILVKCINGDEVVECTSGTLKVINGLPQATCQRDLETDETSVTLTMINYHQISNKTVCEAYVLKRKPAASEQAASNAFEGIQDSGYDYKNTTCPCGWRNQKRIVGGTEADVNEFPLMAGIVDKETGSRYCGGSIITDSFILTAAHCLDDTTASKIRVAVGDHDMRGRIRTGYEQSIDALRLILHENWDKKRLINDIAIIQLAKKISINRNVGPVCLPSSKVDLNGQTITAMGWGLTKTILEKDRGMLRKVELKVADLYSCSVAYGGTINYRRPTQLCSTGRNKDTCQGDSGGPLVWLDPETNRLTQVALVSFGQKCGSSTPGVNTDVSVFMPWVNSVLKRLAPGQAVCTKV